MKLTYWFSVIIATLFLLSNCQSSSSDGGSSSASDDSASISENTIEDASFGLNSASQNLFTSSHIDTADQNYAINAQFLNPPPDSSVLVDVAYSDNRLGNVTRHSIATGVVVSDGQLAYTWDTQSLPEGSYTLHLTVSQSGEVLDLQSQGTVSVVHGDVTHSGYHGDVQQIFQENCQECHQVGGGGVPSFYDYETTVALGSSIKTRVRFGGRHEHVGYMPPFFGADDGSRLLNYRGLSERDIRKIEKWVDDGMPEGDVSNTTAYLPPEASTPAGTMREFTMEAPFQPAQYQSNGEDIYQCFLFDPGFEKTTYVFANDVLPDNDNIVHHVIMYAISPENRESAREAEAADPDPGYRCYGGPLPDVSEGLGGNFITVWAPGNQPAESTTQALKVEAGSLLAMQVHYFTRQDPQGIDQSTVRLWTSETMPQEQLHMLLFADPDLDIPPNEANHRESLALLADLYVFLLQNFNEPRVPEAQLPMTIHSVSPHAHLLGKEITFSVVRRDGSEEEVLHIPKWDFNWQTTYNLKTPVVIDQWDQLKITCIYDNSADNPNQPSSPPIEVSWGDATTDEMCLVFLGTTFGSDTNRVVNLDDTLPSVASMPSSRMLETMRQMQQWAPLMTDHLACNPATHTMSPEEKRGYRR